MVVLEVRARRVEGRQSRSLLEDGHRWNRLRVFEHTRGYDVQITRLTDDRKLVSSTDSIERLGGLLKRRKSPMDALRCRSCHGGETEC